MDHELAILTLAVMRLLGGLAEPAVRSQDPDTHAERPPDCLLAVKTGRPVWLGDEDGHAD
jgi:hypothetical protein